MSFDWCKVIQFLDCMADSVPCVLSSLLLSQVLVGEFLIVQNYFLVLAPGKSYRTYNSRMLWQIQILTSQVPNTRVRFYGGAKPKPTRVWSSCSWRRADRRVWCACAQPPAILVERRFSPELNSHFWMHLANRRQANLDWSVQRSTFS